MNRSSLRWTYFIWTSLTEAPGVPPEGRGFSALPSSVAFSIATSLMCAGIGIYAGIVRAEVPKGGSIGTIGVIWRGHVGTQLGESDGESLNSCLNDFSDTNTHTHG